MYILVCKLFYVDLLQLKNDWEFSKNYLKSITLTLFNNNFNNSNNWSFGKKSIKIKTVLKK